MDMDYGFHDVLRVIQFLSSSTNKLPPDKNIGSLGKI